MAHSSGRALRPSDLIADHPVLKRGHGRPALRPGSRTFAQQWRRRRRHPPCRRRGTAHGGARRQIEDEGTARESATRRIKYLQVVDDPATRAAVHRPLGVDRAGGDTSMCFLHPGNDHQASRQVSEHEVPHLPRPGDTDLQRPFVEQSEAEGRSAPSCPLAPTRARTARSEGHEKTVLERSGGCGGASCSGAAPAIHIVAGPSGEARSSAPTSAPTGEESAAAGERLPQAAATSVHPIMQTRPQAAPHRVVSAPAFQNLPGSSSACHPEEVAAFLRSLSNLIRTPRPSTLVIERPDMMPL